MDIQGVIIGILQLLASLSILVGLHELGHLLAAKYFGVKVEKFSIGFPPKIFGFKWGETEYQLSAIPLGGFVKIAGMIDESLDTEQMKSEPQPWEFRIKPAWQRLIIMLGGIIFNVILGIFIMIVLALAYGEKYVPIEEVNKYGVEVSELGEELGFQNGDKIVNINGQKPTAFKDLLNPNFVLSDEAYYTVERNGKEVKIPITSEFLKEYSSNKEARSFIAMPWKKYPVAVEKIANDSNAEKGGLKQEDRILKIGEEKIESFEEFETLLQKNKGNTLAIQVERDAKKVDLNILVSDEGKLGFIPKPDIPTIKRDYGLGEAMQVGIQTAFGVIGQQAMAYKKMAKGDLDVSESMSGPIGMVMIFGTEFDMYRFWKITGFLSMVLAVMNLLPIPALDGGHVMFLLYEMVTGRPPSDKFLMIAQQVGMVIILCLMVFIFGNDIWKLIRGFFN